MKTRQRDRSASTPSKTPQNAKTKQERDGERKLRGFSFSSIHKSASTGEMNHPNRARDQTCKEVENFQLKRKREKCLAFRCQMRSRRSVLQHENGGYTFINWIEGTDPFMLLRRSVPPLYSTLSLSFSVFKSLPSTKRRIIQK